MSDQAKEKSASQVACENAMNIIGDERVILYVGVREGTNTSWTLQQKDYPMNAETVREAILSFAHNMRTLAGFTKQETVAAIDQAVTEALSEDPDATSVGK